LRLYENKYLSVTSVIDLREPFDDKAFKEWCEKNGKDWSLLGVNSKAIGERLGRYLLDCFEGNRPLVAPCIDMLECRLRQGADKFMKDWKLEKMEEVVVCPELNYAGRYDGIATKGGKKVLFDFKTFGAHKTAPYKRDSKKIKHAKWQLTLYSHAMDFGDKIGVVIFKNNGDYEIELLDFDKGMVEWVEKNQKEIEKVIEENSGCVE